MLRKCEIGIEVLHFNFIKNTDIAATIKLSFNLQ